MYECCVLPIIKWYEKDRKTQCINRYKGYLFGLIIKVLN